MAWQVYRNAAGERWEMNSAGMRLLTHAYCRAKLIRGNYQKTTILENIGTFNLAVANININWGAVNGALPREVREFECNNRQLWQTTLSLKTVGYLAGVRGQTAGWNADMSRVFQKTTNENYANWSAFDSRLAGYSEFARLVRDCCFTFVVLGGGVVSGGIAALATIGAGSVLKGAADAQDNYKGNLRDTKMYESAAITTATTFVSAYLPLKLNAAAKNAVSAVAPRLSGQTTAIAAKGILAIGSSLTDAGGDGAKSIVQGQSVGAALRNAALRSGASLATSAFGFALDAKVPVENVPLMAKVTMPMLANLALKTGVGVAADRIVELSGQSDQAPMRNVPAPLPNAPFCIDNTIVTSDREYILKNVLRPATRQ